MSLLTVYIRKKSLRESNLLDLANVVSTLLNEKKLDFSAVKEVSKQNNDADETATTRDTLTVKPPLRYLDDMIKNQEKQEKSGIITSSEKSQDETESERYEKDERL